MSSRTTSLEEPLKQQEDLGCGATGQCIEEEKEVVMLTSSSDEEEEESSDEEEEYEEERAQILADALVLKAQAMACKHPEIAMPETSIAVTRNYYSRYSAEITDFDREAVFNDMAALKESIATWRNPGAVKLAVDPAMCGRCYFDRASAEPYETTEEVAERESILADAKELKEQAVAYRHPEIGVPRTQANCSRNYYTRPSAVPQHEVIPEDVLQDIANLKEQAMAWRHPEIGVPKTQANCARNYFGRASATEQVSQEDAEEQAQILADAAALKRQAVAYSHPEIGVPRTEVNCARNYFTRVSAPEQESFDEAEVKAQVLADAAALKAQAVAYRYPEIGVPQTAVNCNRNYFTRASAPQQESLEDAETRAQVMADAAALKESAVAYRHPEIGVPSTSTNCARNYFLRGSVYDENIHTEPALHTDDDDDEHHFEMDHFHHDDELVYDDLKASLMLNIGDAKKSELDSNEQGVEDKEGNLSRSPSSVMLFGLDNTTAY